ncbi:MAG: NAD(P)-dependent oxidoreductase [Nitrospiraceae bacterium]|nr:NAD(P)-dependent oxidoreductase [Nitrospiraceae bacterium]
MNITFVGTGHMGEPMVERLLGSRFPVTLYNRTKSRALPLLEKGALWAETPALGAAWCDVIATMVADDSALENLLVPGGILEALPEGAVHLSFSTISVDYAASLEKRHAAHGHGFVSAPVFGRPDAVREGRLRILCAGKEESVQKVLPILNALGPRVFPLGESPSTANLVKLAGNFMIAATLETLGESFSLTKKAGVDPSLFLEIVNDSLFHSPLYGNYGRIMAEKRYDKAGFTMDLGLKDINLVLKAASDLRVPLPLGGILRDSFLSGLAKGRQPLDWSAVVLSHYERAGLPEES